MDKEKNSENLNSDKENLMKNQTYNDESSENKLEENSQLKVEEKLVENENADLKELHSCKAESKVKSETKINCETKVNSEVKVENETKKSFVKDIKDREIVREKNFKAKSSKGLSENDSDFLEIGKKDNEKTIKEECSDLKDKVDSQKIDVDEIYEQIQKNKRRKILLAVVSIIALIVSIMIFLMSSYFNIEKVEVSGNKYFTKNEIVGMANVNMNENLLFKLNKSEIIERLTKSPYIKDVEIDRKLPNKVKIIVKEREQILTIGYGNRYLVLDSKGRLLRKTDIEPKITLITGIKIKELKVGEFIKVEPQRKLEVALDILNKAKKNNLFFKKLDLRKPVIRAYVYDELIIKGTEDRIIGSIENNSLQKVIADLFSKNILRGVINVGGDGYISYSPNTNEV